MVFIHGGGLMGGSSTDEEPEGLSILGDVIHVSINYRLAVFGFMATEDESVPGNAGFHDQVSENISNPCINCCSVNFIIKHISQSPRRPVLTR